MDLNPEVEFHIGRNIPWSKLPNKIKDIFGNSHKGYEKAIITYSIRNQVRFSDSLVKTIRKDEGKYYEELVAYSKEKLMLYPYHLSDKVVKGLRITPFQYYHNVMERIMDQEKSYDSLPNFTSIDCLRLLGIGRNQYIDLMNQYRSSRKLFRRKPPRELLPTKPIVVPIEPWFIVHVGFITEADIQLCKPLEKVLIDNLIDHGAHEAGKLEKEVVQSLYRKGLVYIDVPIENEDFIVVPPLEGFVMNRILGDYFETLLYKIFVSISEHTTIESLASLLDIDVKLIKNAVSLYCRLGFAYKKNLEIDYSTLDPSWKNHQPPFKQQRNTSTTTVLTTDELIDDITSALSETSSLSDNIPRSPEPTDLTPGHSSTNCDIQKRIAFLYDSTLTAYLMMGNLSSGLKNHAVTMFEVGKMADESLDSFLAELDKLNCSDGEGEAQRYFEHAKTLKTTIRFLRNNPNMGSMGLDLLRCESLLNLDKQSCSRLLNRNYEILVSMAPLSYEVKAICCDSMAHFGPSISQINSIWFKIFLYSYTKSGPSSLLIPRGTLLYELPKELEDCEFYLITTWGHDSAVIPGSNALFTLNEALGHSAVFVQEYGRKGESSTVIVPFPFSKKTSNTSTSSTSTSTIDKTTNECNNNLFLKWEKHPAILNLVKLVDPENNCGYITMMNLNGSTNSSVSDTISQGSTFLPNYNYDNSSTFLNPLPLPLSILSNVQEVDEEKDESISEEDVVYVQNNSNNSSTVQINYPSSECSEKSAFEEPKNGFKNNQCAKLYEDALAEEFQEFQEFASENEKNKLTEIQQIRKPKNFDMRQQKIESLRLDLTTNMSHQQSLGSEMLFKSDKEDKKLEKNHFVLDEWTLLDTEFGIPLFDGKINEIICNRMVENDLWDKKSLENLLKSNEGLARQLQEFINTYQSPNHWKEEIPYPTRCFYFNRGILEEFQP